MNSVKIKIVCAFALVILSCACFVQAGQEGKGGFTSFYAKELLKISINELLSFIESVDYAMFKTNPERRVLVTDALENLQIIPTETRMRYGEELFLDYDKVNNKIIVLKPFIDAFKIGGNKELVKRMLLHEAAHLWDFSDIEAETFAKAVLKSHILNPFSDGLENTCSNLNLITSKYDNLDVRSCYQSVVEKYCSQQNLFNPDSKSREVLHSNAKIAREISRDLGDCRFSYWADLVEPTRERSEILEWSLLNASSDFITEAVGG